MRPCWRRVIGPSKSAAIPADPMVLWKHYHVAKSIQDALTALTSTGESARLIAGGTDLLLDLGQGRHPPLTTLVDITNVPELNVVEIRGNRLFIGAAVPLNQLIEDSLILEHAQAVVEACRLIGGPQVRNTATLGGNVAHALPAGDGTIALIALDASAVIADKFGSREVYLKDLFIGPGKSIIDPKEEILVGFYINKRKIGQASCFSRVMRPQGVALPILNIAVWMYRDQGYIRDVRISLGPSGPIPRRATATEEVLRGEIFTDELIYESHSVLIRELSFRTSPLRASADYRRHLSRVLIRDAITNAFERAGCSV